MVAYIIFGISSLLCMLLRCQAMEAFAIKTGSGLHTFSNVSLGLENNEKLNRQCLPSGKLKYPNAFGSMSYTPNRRPQAASLRDSANHELRTAVVMALAGGHRATNLLMLVWDSWVDNFLPVVSNTTSLVLLFDRRDYLQQNHSQSPKEYLDKILVRNMGATPVNCVVYSTSAGDGRRARKSLEDKANQCKHRNELMVDRGYLVYSINTATPDNPHQRPILIFATVHVFPPPKWAAGLDENDLDANWWKTSGEHYSYVKYTNWYDYHMLNLRLLDFFDYGAKIDNDISFTRRFPESNLGRRLAEKGAMLMASHAGVFRDHPVVTRGVRECLANYTIEESKRCSRSELPAGGQLVPGGFADKTFFDFEQRTTIVTYFTVFWLGLYTAPETKHMARYFNEFHPEGMWKYRWGDQQWFPRPISMFGVGNTSQEVYRLDLHDGYIVHKAIVREFREYWLEAVGTSHFFNPVNGSTRASRAAEYHRLREELCRKTDCWLPVAPGERAALSPQTMQ